ncbi:MAG: valine--tRNA ligase [Planctomycetes bacterium]|nr:valine--tRNA ligase [Planctomycetota bacterium]
MTMDLPTRFDPKTAEPRIYADWESKGYFHASVREGKRKFSISIPPPNITGVLHIGHVLDNTPQDILVRYRRMQGLEACWIPGTDHAGIATQHVVERALSKEGVRRQQLGREKFVERVWAWKKEYGDTIIAQLKRLGCSCDWQRARFTMDEGCSRAVLEAFCRLYEKGLVYRGDYIVNWCTKDLTALSDEEAEKKEIEGGLYSIQYPIRGAEGHVVVATTRPETMLGDTAVAVHPSDERYKHLVGKTLVLPLTDREIPVVADAFVDPKFGTGAVKVTPAHDPNDFWIGERHGLPKLNVMTPDGKMNENAPEAYRGLDRFECRKRVVKDLEALGLFVEKKPHLHAVGHCYRCETIVEPRLSKQWFVKMKPLAEPCVRAYHEGRVRFFPERWTKTYLEWMENIRDWCISRQLWWGHRIPVWYCEECGKETVARTTPTSCAHCPSTKLRQDEDVLDTWFSSWLWPFSTLGWPDETPELQYFYPNDWLNSGKDILFFWVARMLMAGQEFTGKLPFAHVYIHSIARDGQGRKISKSLGNSPDILKLIDQYGADALRFGIIANTPMGQDVKLDDATYELGRNFVTKVWNASRFLLMNLTDESGGTGAAAMAGPAFEDRWISSRLHLAIQAATERLERYEFGEAVHALHQFFWHDYCDWYIEIVKPRLAADADAGSRARARRTLLECLTTILRLLHPFIPFVTEELWQKLRSVAGAAEFGGGTTLAESLMLAPWPAADASRLAPDVDAAMLGLMEVVRGIRDVRNKMNIPRSQRLSAIVRLSSDGDAGRALHAHERLVREIAALDGLEIGAGLARPPKSATCVLPGMEVYLPLGGVIDVAKERGRQEQARKKVEEQLAAVRKKLSSHEFVAKAPEEVVTAEKAREASLTEQVEKLDVSLKDLAGWE